MVDAVLKQLEAVRNIVGDQIPVQESCASWMHTGR